MKNKNNIVILIVSVLTCILLAISMNQYYQGIYQEFQEATIVTLQDSNAQQKSHYEMTLQSEVSTLKAISDFIRTVNETEAVVNYIQLIETSDKYHFVDLIVCNHLGEGIKSDGIKSDFSDAAFFQDVMSGEAVITSQNSEGAVNVFIAVPIKVNDEVVGATAATIEREYLDSLLFGDFDGEGYTLVSNRDGDIVASSLNQFSLISNEDNLIELIQGAKFHEGKGIQDFVESISSGGNDTYLYTLSGEERVARVCPIEGTEFSMISVIPMNIISRNAENIIYQSVLTFAVVIFILLALAVSLVLYQRKSLKELERISHYDELTEIPNLMKFKKEVKGILEQHRNLKFTIFKFDMINFKAINELYDFEVGNRVIRAIADVGKGIHDFHYVQARVGTDEFLLFAESAFFEGFAEKRAFYEGKFRENSGIPVQHKFSFKYGRYEISKGETDINQIINNVTMAHRICKGLKNIDVYDYDDSLKKRLLKNVEIGNKIQAAFDHREFQVFLQAKFDTNTLKISGAEALVRWIEADGKMIYPDEFIPLIEQNGYIVSLDHYMLEEVCKHLVDIKERGLEMIPISVNYSRICINQEDFVERVCEVVERYRIPKHLIEIEVTESAIIENKERFKEVLQKLQSKGFLIAMDDFGAGYSSLELLQNYRFDILKLDRSLITSEENIERKQILLQGFLDIAKRLHITTVAEGVETKEQESMLKAIHCDIMQGYYYAKPVDAETFKVMLAANK